ncbi:MAG: hypothetical protein K0S37_3658 [Microbacterium sp.]|jgi:hypothetical protein|nr:hypothetical protein [Microbacterium sp.]
MACDHGTRLEVGSVVWCFDCDSYLTDTPLEQFELRPLERRRSGSFAEFLADEVSKLG